MYGGDEMKNMYRIVVGKPLRRSMHILEERTKIYRTNITGLCECLVSGGLM